MSLYGRGKTIIQPATCENCCYVRSKYNANNPEGFKMQYTCGNEVYKGTPVYFWETCAYYQRDCLCYNQKGDQDGKR